MSRDSSYDDRYRTMIDRFRTIDLKTLLESFKLSKNGRKSVLKDRALNLLRNRPGINYLSYRAKIVEIYRSLLNKTPNNGMLQSQSQQLLISRGGILQVTPRMQRVMFVNNNSGNNIQYNNQPGVHRIILQSQSLANIRLKKLPFYEVQSAVMNPTILVGKERCSLPNSRDMREATFKINMSSEQINYISMNRDVTKNLYIFQLQIRICLLESNLTEISDFLPSQLHIRINDKVCPLPPSAPNTRPGTKARRMASPINCTQLLKLNPSLSNTITISWMPDAKTYVVAVNLVEKLNSSTLLQKLNDKGARTSDETMEYIIEKLANVDPDLTTTSYRFSLVCPLSKVRMRIPAKSMNCDHLQCFDASTFILMNEKTPTWLCPTCNKPCLFDDIQIQNYFLEVLSSSRLPDSCQEIELLADGTWQIHKENKEPVESVADKEKSIDYITLDSSDDENSTDDKKETNTPESSNKETENLKVVFIDFTLNDEELSKDEQESIAADVVQPATTMVDLKPQVPVQLQQVITSSEQDMVIEID